MAADDDTTTELQLTMKLFINAGARRRVLFAEASRDVMDFLYSLLVSPDTAVSLNDATCRGCIDNLVESFDELDYLDGRPPSPAPLLLQQPQLQPQPRRPARRFFLCGARRGAGCDGYVASKSGVRCPSCGGTMDAEAPPGAPGAGWSGDAAAAAAAVVAGTLTCTLLDDLSLGPMIGNALLAVGEPLQEATVRLGRKEGLEILKASLHSSSVLTNVFLRGKALVLY